MNKQPVAIDPDRYLRDLIRDVHEDDVSLRMKRLYSTQVHAAHSQPLFGILGKDFDTLLWTAGGLDIATLICSGDADCAPVTRFTELLSRLGIKDTVIDDIHAQMAALPQNGQMNFAQRLPGADGRTFSIVFRNRGRGGPCDGRDALQFTVNDISHFVTVETDIRDMARHIMARLNDPAGDDRSALEFLQFVRDGIDKVHTLDRDDDIAELASKIAESVNELANASVNILRGFENAGEADKPATSTGEPTADIPSVIPVHARPLGDRATLMKRVSALTTSGAALKPDEALALYFANTFIKNAIPVFVSIYPNGDIFILNGPAAGGYNGIDEMIRAMGVEENSRQTASNFFTSKEHRQAVMSINASNVEIRGHPTEAAWQAVIMPSATDTFDVRGLFHAFKNLILNLQVLYVVKTREDVDKVGEALSKTLSDMDTRLDTLMSISQGGRMRYPHRVETVGQWVETMRNVAEGMNCHIDIDGLENQSSLSFMSPSGVMEDSMTEITLNALQNGAENLSVRISSEKSHLRIAIRDDGHGMSAQKLRQLRTVIGTLTHDATLTTRPGGSGHGLLGIATMMSHFVDGALQVGKNPDGRGTEVSVSMLLPSSLQDAA
ncbi:MAG: ATP-binding protein [Alphaproteobacteria bacterium]